MLRSYHAAVFSDRLLALEFLRIGIITALYCLAIIGFGHALCRRLPGLGRSFIDFFATRLVTGCVVLYGAFIVLSLATLLRPPFVAIVLIAGLAFAAINAKEIVVELR